MIFTAYPEEQRDLRWVTVTLTVLATILLMIRMITTMKLRGWLGIEDAFVMAANFFLILLAAFIYKSTTYGFGMRLEDIKKTGGNVTKAMKYFWLTQSFYTLTNGFNKMAFLALYYRIFPMKGFRQACMVMMAISVGWTVSYLFVCIFQCTPIARVYNRAIPGTCINFAWHRWSNATLNLLTDVTIFILPMPVIYRLNMSSSSRIGLFLIFSVGFFICLTTALRMATLPLTLKTGEPTWTSAPTNLWSFIEAATGVICACLISLRKSIGALWPEKWCSLKVASSRQYQKYGSEGLHAPEISRTLNGAEGGNTVSYPLRKLKSGGRGRLSTHASISPSESQVQIIEDPKEQAHVTTNRIRSESTTERDDIILQGITKTTDIKIVRY